MSIIQFNQEEPVNQERYGIKDFQRWMRRRNMSDNTITSYSSTIRNFLKKYRTVNKNTLLSYRHYLLINNYNPRTINQKMAAINKFLEFSHKKSLSLKYVKIQARPYLENVITENDYRYFCKKLKESGSMKTYFIVKFIACTGARPSELIKFTVEDVYNGKMDIYSKGGKFRRIYIPKHLQKEAIPWLHSQNLVSGTIFKNNVNKETITPRGVNKLLKTNAAKYKQLDLNTIYAYSFRHFFAKSFIKKAGEGGIILLSDLLGHESLNTTRIYTRMSSIEQYETINQIVRW